MDEQKDKVSYRADVQWSYIFMSFIYWLTDQGTKDINSHRSEKSSQNKNQTYILNFSREIYVYSIPFLTRQTDGHFKLYSSFTT